MIGIIPRILTDMVREQCGEDTLQHIFKAANIPSNRTYHNSHYYDDSEWQSFYEQTKKTLELDEEQTSKAYADAFLSYVLKTFPTWFDMANNSYDFLALQPTIHNSFASGLVDSEKRKAAIDKFSIEKKTKHLITHYRSPNKLCSTYIALAKSVIKHYGDEAEITETKCLKNGDAECELHVKWK